MTPEARAYWDKTLTGLVRAIGDEGAKEVAMETARRMGDGASVRESTAMLLRVLGEWAGRHGYSGSMVALVNEVSRDVADEILATMVAKTQPPSVG